MPEPKTKPPRQLSFSVPGSAWEAIEFVGSIHGDKYDGVAPVLMDYSVNECVAIHEKAKQKVGAA